MKTEDFIKQALANDDTALRKFYVGNKKAFAGFIRSKYDLDDETINDLYQDAVVALIEHARKGNLNEVKASVTTYLFSIGKNMALKKHQKKDMMVVTADSLADLPDLPETDGSEQLLLIAEKISLLGESCQRLLRQFYYEGKKLDDIVREGNYSGKDVVKSQKSRCLAQLKKLING